LPEYVDTRKIFQKQGELSGTVAIERLAGFQQYLISKSAEIEVELSFSLNESSKRIISGTLDASVSVACQRCLEPVKIILKDNFRLALVNDESQIGGLGADFEPWICEDKNLILTDVIEEQLILCLPIVSYHANDSCQAITFSTQTTELRQKGAKKESNNPFAVLQTLKSDKTK
jgi:uncharacterized protein